MSGSLVNIDFTASEELRRKVNTTVLILIQHEKIVLELVVLIPMSLELIVIMLQSVRIMFQQ